MNKLIIVSLIALLFGSCKINNIVTSTEMVGNLPHKEGKHYILGVRGECEMCQEEIERVARYNVTGVTFAYWVQGEQKLLVDFDSTKTNIDSISIAIARRGYDTDRHIANTNVYNTLPQCCRYR